MSQLEPRAYLHLCIFYLTCLPVLTYEAQCAALACQAASEPCLLMS